jgi:AraC-like DNA-binding protein
MAPVSASANDAQFRSLLGFSFFFYFPIMESVKRIPFQGDGPQLSLHECACLRNELVWIYDHAPGSRTLSANRDRAQGNWAWYLRSGRLSFSTPRGVLHLRPGQWLMLPEGPATHVFSANARLLSIHYRCQWPSGENLLRSNGLVISGARHPRLEKQAARLERFVRRSFPGLPSYQAYPRQVSGYGGFLRLQALFYAWLEDWMEIVAAHGAGWTRLRPGDDRLLRAMRCLNEAPLSGGFPRQLLAKETGLSLVHLNRLWSLEFGSSLRRSWEKRLLQQAKDALADPALPVKELAYRLGFGSDSLFVNWFRRLVRMSPGAYRRRRGAAGE